MGKKKKKKLKKKFIKQRLQALEQQGFKAGPKEKPAPAAPFNKKEKKKFLAKSEKETTEEKDYIKRDLRKAAIIAGIFIVIFVVLIIVNSRTDFLSQAANKIFSALSIG